MKKLEDGVLFEVARVNVAFSPDTFPFGDGLVIHEMLTEEVVPPELWLLTLIFLLWGLITVLDT